MVEIFCPHCEEEIGLDDDAVGEFSCPYCDEDFTWNGILDDGETEVIYDWKGFWMGFGIPTILVAMAWILGVYFENLHDRSGRFGRNYSGDFIYWFHLTSFVSWIAFLIYGISVKRKGMWQGALTAMAAIPAVLILGIIYFIEATNWSMF